MLADGLSVRWTASGDDERLACDVAVPLLRFDAAKACLGKPRDADTAKTDVEQWVAHVHYRAMVHNQDGEGQAAKFVERVTKYLRRYCAGVPELEGATAELDSFGCCVQRH